VPKAKTGNFTLRRIATAVPAPMAAHRLVALQRSGQYSELRLIQRGKSAFDIVGYRWPDKGVRRKLGIGKKNPAQGGATTPNQVLFGMRGHTKVGWVNRETKTRYEITYKDGAQTRQVWRLKSKVKFQATGRTGRVPNNCPKQANPTPLQKAEALSRTFHHFDPRYRSRADVKWPKSLTLLGELCRLDYDCSKFDGKRRIYFHEFKKGSRVWAAPESVAGKGVNMIVLTGRFKITPEGIEG